METVHLDRLSMTDPDVIACPFGAYRRMQVERPVFHDPKTGYYEITRFKDVQAVALDHETFSNKVNRQNRRPQSVQAAMQSMYDKAGFPPVPTLLNNDPPSQRQIRALVDKAFLPARINKLQPAILAEVTRLLDAMLCHGCAEFMSEFAVPLPLNIIADQLGVARGDRTIIKEGSDALINVADPMTADDDLLEFTRRIIEMQKLLADRIHAARHQPDETILSVVANSEGDVGLPLLVHLFQSILVAGNETTTNALGNSLLMLIDDPSLFERLACDASQVPTFVEEALRIKAPFQGFYRLVTKDTEIAGTSIPKGAIVFLRWGATSHDGSQFTSPEMFRLDRSNLKTHMTFGAGTHFCLGNLLARTELRIAFQQIVERLRDLRLADGEDARVLTPSFLNQGVGRIQITFSQRSRTAS